MTQPVAGIPGSEQIRLAPQDAEVWRDTLDSIAYAPRIGRPFLFLSAANDFYGAMDFVDTAIGLIPHSSKWQSFTPHFNHHVEPEQSTALPMWMDPWLKGGAPWPKTPRMQIAFEGGEPAVTLTPDQAVEVRGAAIF
jgi:hypothetical protein